MMLFAEIDFSKPIEGFGDKLAFGAEKLLVGIAIVFAVLALMWLSLELLRILCYDLPNKRKTQALAPKTENAPAAVAAPMAAPSEEDEIAVVIAAAVAAAESEMPKCKFRAVSFKRIH